MKTVSEVSRLSGISVRTLRYYDEIGLLHPTEKTAAGYRLYDDAALARLQTILLLRSLDFSLEKIKVFLCLPPKEQREMLQMQVKLLRVRRRHYDKLITLAQNLLKGESTMDFSPFDQKEQTALEQEIRDRWGNTAAFAEYRARRQNGTVPQNADALTAVFAQFGAVRRLAPESAEAQALVRQLQDVISASYYTCTKEILSSLGEMYVADERFCRNIDEAGGTGTAEFVRNAIRHYCNI